MLVIIFEVFEVLFSLVEEEARVFLGEGDEVVFEDGAEEAGPAGIEPTTTGLKVRCSSKLSYGPRC